MNQKIVWEKDEKNRGIAFDLDRSDINYICPGTVAGDTNIVIETPGMPRPDFRKTWEKREPYTASVTINKRKKSLLVFNEFDTREGFALVDLHFPAKMGTKPREFVECVVVYCLALARSYLKEKMLFSEKSCKVLREYVELPRITSLEKLCEMMKIDRNDLDKIVREKREIYGD